MPIPGEAAEKAAEIRKKLLKNPRKSMVTFAEHLKPSNLGEVDHKSMRNLIKASRYVLAERPGDLGEHLGTYEEMVSNAEKHMKNRGKIGKRIAERITEVLNDRKQALGEETLGGIGRKIDRLETHFGFGEEEIAELTSLLENRVQHETLVDIIAQEDKLKGALLGKVKVPPEASEHLEAVAKTAREIDIKEEELKEASKNFLDAVYGVALEGLDESSPIEKKDFELADESLKYSVGLYGIHNIPIKHLMEFAGMLERARKLVPKED